MLEAKLQEASVLKKLLESIKELVTDANFGCSEEGMKLQAMDNSHVALVAVELNADSFKKYRCDREMSLGVNLASLTKVLKCAKDDDVCTLKATDDADVLNLVYEAKNSDRIAEYDIKLMDIDSDTLGIPDTEYEARVTMPSAEFARIVRDLSQLGESVKIEVSKEGVRFASDGESANGNVLLKPTDGAGVSKMRPKVEEKPDVEQDDEEEDDEDAEDKKVKKQKAAKVKKEKTDDDVDMDEEAEEQEEFKPGSDGEEEVVDSDEEGDGKKRKKKSNGDSKPSKKAKTSKGKGKKKEDDEKPFTSVEMNSHVALTFSLKYLVNFSKSSSLHSQVQLMMSNDVPLLVAYEFGQGSIKYYLAPKIGDD
ncbi:proliferating cell nuclear antigen, N-terminal domain-containing protein [Mycena floridula]|nr:proliferating cell nuclear antigen, N-terminal domain-containing protein [Mycena floridula]